VLPSVSKRERAAPLKAARLLSRLPTTAGDDEAENTEAEQSSRDCEDPHHHGFATTPDKRCDAFGS
jgi:hypothetical protein